VKSLVSKPAIDAIHTCEWTTLPITAAAHVCRRSVSSENDERIFRDCLNQCFSIFLLTWPGTSGTNCVTHYTLLA